LFGRSPAGEEQASRVIRRWVEHCAGLLRNGGSKSSGEGQACGPNIEREKGITRGGRWIRWISRPAVSTKSWAPATSSDPCSGRSRSTSLGGCTCMCNQMV
jgi:hypothetical protein